MSKSTSAVGVATSDKLVSTDGRTTFADSVIATIAGIAAREVPGVHKLGKGLLGDAVGMVSGTQATSRGVNAEVGRKEVAIDLEMIVDYGYSLQEVAAQVRQLVGARLSQMTDLSVKEVNIAVVDVYYAPDEVAPSRRVE
jgi:uncharacterized alkaline shock family protein YloU